jgi:hypothetical protein
MLTAAAGLISAITGLVVAAEQLRPASHTSPATAAAITRAADTTPATATSQSGSESPPTSVVAAHVSFPAGSHVQLGSYRYDFLSATATAGNPGELALAIRVKLTNDDRFDANFWGRSFRLRIGSDVNAPTNFLNDLVHGGTTGTAEVDFTFPAATRNATLLVGDDPAKAVSVPLAFREAK